MRYPFFFLLFFFASTTGHMSYAASPAVSVGVAKIELGELAERVSLVGSVIPRRSSQISTQVAGQITEIAVDRGSVVRQGDVLFRLDDELTRFDLQAAQAALDEAKAEEAEAERKLREAERLRGEGHIPQSVLDTAQTVASVATARRSQRDAQVSRSRALLKRHTVRAPYAGTVVAKTADIGQWIRLDSPVVTLVETNPARIEVPVPQRLYRQLRPGSSADLWFESLPDERFTAEVGALVPQGSEGARTFPVWLELDNAAGRIAPGMSARVALATSDTPRTVLLVPSDALVRRADGSTLIWLVREEEPIDGLVAKAVQVEVGSARGSKRQVEGAGLAAGDLVVVRGNEGLRPNQLVRITSTAAGR